MQLDDLASRIAFVDVTLKTFWAGHGEDGPVSRLVPGDFEKFSSREGGKPLSRGRCIHGLPCLSFWAILELIGLIVVASPD